VSKQQPYSFETDISALITRLSANLYNDKFTCLRELVQNASDACLIAEGTLRAARGRIDITIDRNNSVFSITDTGIGMTEEDLRLQLSTIATSHKASIRRELSDTFEGSSGIAGRFGIGFLSVFIVSDDVTVITRHHNEPRNGYIWRSKGDGSYSIEASPRQLPKGTTVQVKIREDARDLLDVNALIATLKRHCPFIRTPYFINSSALSVNHDVPPWYEEASGDAGRSYILEQFSCNPIIEFRIAYDGPGKLPEDQRHIGSRSAFGATRAVTVPRVRLNGYFAIPDKSVEFTSARCRVYTAGLYVDSIHDVLPAWANFIVGGVECPDLELTLGRNHVMDNPTWWAAQQILTEELTQAIVKSLQDTRARTRRSWELVFKHHREQILRVARDERQGYYRGRTESSGSQFFSAVRDLIPFKSGSDWLTIDEMIQRKHALVRDGKLRMFYLSLGSQAHEGAGIQERMLFEEASYHYIEAQNYYERDVLQQINKDRDDVELKPVQDAVRDIVSAPSDAARAQPLIDIFKMIGVTAQMVAFEPSSLAAIVSLRTEEQWRPDRIDPEDPTAMADLLSVFARGRKVVSVRPYVLLVNERNPLVQKVIEQIGIRGGDTLIVQIVRQIYYSAILVFGDRDATAISEIVPNMSGVMASFIGYLAESERELHRVRGLAEEDRRQRLEIELTLEKLVPADSDPRSVFLSYSFDDNSERLAGQLRGLLEARELTVQDGHVDETGSLSSQVIDRIRRSGAFIGLVTPRATGSAESVSGWVLEEKGAALALGKPTLLIGHDSVPSESFRRLGGDNIWITSDGSEPGWAKAFEQAVSATLRTLAESDG
jgi:HSP90 family molecular chaperone